MRLLSRLDDETKSGATWYVIFWQSPNLPVPRRVIVDAAPE
jgi:hypothetical protein